MNKLIAVVFAAMFAAVSFQAVAQDKKPTAEQCKKDPKLKGCEAGEEVSAVRAREGGANPAFSFVRGTCAKLLARPDAGCRELPAPAGAKPSSRRR